MGMGGPGFGMHRPPMERSLGLRGGRWWNEPAMIEKLRLTDDQRKAMDQILLEHREKLIDMIVRNARLMQRTVENLAALSRTDNDARQHHHLRLAVAAREAARQLREHSRDARVEIRLEEFPEVEVNAAAVELCVTNYLSNAIKYADPNKTHRDANAFITAKNSTFENGIDAELFPDLG